MTRLRFMIVTALAVFTVGVIGASTASAAFELSKVACDKGKVSICYDTVEKGKELRELVGEEEFTVSQIGKALLTATFNKKALAVHVECEATKVDNGLVLQLEPLVKATTLDIEAILFTGCKSIEPNETKCTITNKEINTKPIVGEAVNQEKVDAGVNFAPETGEIFAEISYKGAECLLKGSQRVTGTQICLWVTPEEDLVDHELKCSPAESKLFFGLTNEPASLELTLLVTLPALELAKDFWDIALS